LVVGATARRSERSPLVSTRGVGRDDRAVGRIDGDFRTAVAGIANSLPGSSLGQILIADEEITELICVPGSVPGVETGDCGQSPD